MMTDDVHDVIRSEKRAWRRNHDDVHGLIRSEKKLSMDHDDLARWELP